MSELNEEELAELDPAACFEWLTGMVRMCGDTPPTAQQWARLAQMVETVQANKVRKRIMQDQATKQWEATMTAQKMYTGAVSGLAGAAGSVATQIATGYTTDPYTSAPKLMCSMKPTS